ncbi:hypothetical protein [Burkholderia cenocepacia]|uniref:hypothetical protein n=1 Tax=Burkholderia cenocepacia TaxID=95486 RepID=UPI002238C216|nr:hypothetical protein [Burkholderia cenocepacia]MCW5156409.1 hypothetical protein [Burkholderia cenocepacia]
MSKYYNNYSLSETSANEGLSERDQLEGHLYLGTAKFQFCNSDGKVVDTINILDQFYLRVMVWNGKYDKQGNLKYEFSSELSDSVFAEILNDMISRRGLEKEDKAALSKIAKKSNKVKEFTFFMDDWNAYSNDGNDWGNKFDKKWSTLEEPRLEEFLARHPYFRQYDKEDVLSPDFTMFRKGMNRRYYAKHHKDFNFNKYIIDYWSYLNDKNRKTINLEIIKIGEDGIITGDMFKQKFLGGSEFAYMSLPLSRWHYVEKGEFFMNIANSWTHLSILDPEYFKDDDFVLELLSFNPKIPTFLISDYLSKRENMIRYLENIYRSSNMSAISPEIVKKWHDDEEISEMILEGLCHDLEDRSRVYRLLSDRVKIAPSIIKKVDARSFKFIPKTYLENEDNVINLIANHHHHEIESLVRALPKKMRESLTILKRILARPNHNDVELRLPCSLFSKNFIQEFIECGAKADIKGSVIEKERYNWFRMGDIELKQFAKHTRSVIFGLIEHDKPCRIGEYSLVWNNDPKGKDLVDLHDYSISGLLKRGKIKCVHPSSKIYITEEVLDAVRTKRFADKLTVDLEKEKPIEGTTKSGRAKI